MSATPTPTASRFPLPTKTAALLAALGGALYCLGFPGIGLWPLAFIAQAPLIVALRNQSPKRAAWLGTLNGTVMTTGGFYWLLEMLKVFGGFPLPLSMLFVFIICAYQGARHGAIAWLAARAQARGYSQPLAYAAAFATSELLYPLLFPWYTAASLVPAPVFVQAADLGGPILVGLILVAFNLAVAEFAIARLEGRAPDRRLLIVGAASVALSAVYGFVRIKMIDARMAASDKAKVGVVQANMGLMQKRTAASEGLRRHVDLTHKLKNEEKIDFVVWSESSVMYTFPEPTAEGEIRERVSGRLGLPALFGAVVIRRGSEPDDYRLFNTSFSTDELGRVQSRYDKQFLLMFGEYLPFSETFPIMHKWSPNSGRFSPGKSLEPLLIPVGGKTRKVSMLICYEDILPSFVNSAVRHAAPDLLVNITNDAWFGDTTEPWQHLALAQLRAVEQRRYLVRSTNSGVSAVVDAVGRVTAKTGTFKIETLATDIRFMQSTTLYGLIGDVPWYLATVLSIGMAFRKRRGASPTSPAEAEAKPH